LAEPHQCTNAGVWGEQDGIVTPDYGRAFAQMIPGARFETIAGAAIIRRSNVPMNSPRTSRDF